MISINISYDDKQGMYKPEIKFSGKNNLSIEEWAYLLYMLETGAFGVVLAEHLQKLSEKDYIKILQQTDFLHSIEKEIKTGFEVEAAKRPAVTDIQGVIKFDPKTGL